MKSDEFLSLFPNVTVGVLDKLAALPMLVSISLDKESQRWQILLQFSPDEYSIPLDKKRGEKRLFNHLEDALKLVSTRLPKAQISVLHHFYELNGKPAEALANSKKRN